jgi:DNA-binding beta-propeller fold protein YncE
VVLPEGGGGSAVAVSTDGTRVFVTGTSLGKFPASNDYATIAYNAVTGAQLWVKRYDGTPNYAGQPPEALSVAVSPTTGTVFVTGCIISVGGSQG